MTQEKKVTPKSKFRTIIIPTLVIIFFLGVIMIYYTMLYQETRQKIIKNGEVNSVLSSDQIDKYLSQGVDILKLACHTLDNMIRNGNSQKEIHEFLVNQSVAVGNTTTADSTGIYGWVRGEYLDGLNWVPEEDYVPTERPWYICARASVGRVAVVDPYVDAMTGNVLITFSKTLCDAKSVVSLDYSMERLQEITEETVALGEIDMEIVIDQKYQVIAHSDKNEVGKNYLDGSESFGNALVEKLRTTDDGFFSFTYEGADYIVYATSVANDWLCLSVFNATKIFGQLRFTLIFTIIASILIVAILLAILIRSNMKEAQSNRLSNIVESLAEAIDAKDAYTKGHSGRVADYAKEISKRHGDSEKEQNDIYMMGLLHDVGKIGIPDAVINKPSKLTNEEFEIIKTHPDIGSKILAKTEGMIDTVNVVHAHHERFDGKGYPSGISGNEIPKYARIIAVADAYDAMTSRRSYRDSLAQDIVRQEIEKGKGSQFDPEYADIMLQMIEEDKDYKMRGE